MATDIKNKLEESKINISAQLENIGVFAGELLNSSEAVENHKLYRMLSVILRKTFITYVSTQDLEGYLLTDESEIVESEKRHLKNFFEYRREIVRIDSFINIELGKFSNGSFADATDKENYIALIESSNRLIKWLEELFKVEVAIKMERANNDNPKI